MSAYAVIRASSIEQLVRDVSPPMLERLARKVQERAIATCPEGDTGMLRASIEAHPTSAKSVVVAAHTSYARYVHDGTRPHRIVPRGPYPLRFYWENEGIRFEGWSVNHPGARPQPWLRDALDAVMRSI